MAPKAPDAMPVTEDIAERTQAMMGNYFSWLQNAMSASPWANMELNRKLMSYATESVSAYVEHTQRLSQARNLEDAAKIQTEFVQAQIEVFNQRAKELGEIYAKMATARPFGMST
jgi:hypothetical protein